MTDTVICVGDLHGASRYALCPPEVPLDNGGTYLPNPIQKQLWAWWLDFLVQASEIATRNGGETYFVVNGETTEGIHHGNTSVVSGNPADQYRCARMVLEPVRTIASRLFIVRGTDAHSGESGRHDEALATMLGAEQNPATGTHSFYVLRLAPGGVNLRFTHHSWGATRPWTEGGNANRMAAAYVYEYANDPENRPDLAIHSHVHRWADSYDQHLTRVVIMGPWKAQGESFGHKFDPIGRRLEFGGVVISVGDGEYEVKKIKYRPERGAVWRP